MPPESKRPLKILHCITSLSGDGAQNMLLKLVSTTDRTRFEHKVVSMLVPWPGCLHQKFADAGIEVSDLGLTRALPMPGALNRLARELRAYQPDLVQGWMYHANIAAQAARALSRLRSPLLWNIRHSIEDLAHEKPLTKALIKAGAPLSRTPVKIIYCAESSARQHEALGYRPDRSVVLPNGFDISRFAPSDDAYAALRRSLAIPADAKIVGIVGRYHPIKDHHSFLRAAAAVAPRLPALHFVMIGQGMEASNNELMELINELGIQERVHLLGVRSDVPQLMPGFDLYCSSSVSEGFPNVLGEAMSCEVPCIATAAGASADILDGTGAVVQPRDWQGLAHGLESFAALPREQLKEHGRRCRERISSVFSLPVVVRQYEALYCAVRGDAH